MTETLGFAEQCVPREPAHRGHLRSAGRLGITSDRFILTILSVSVFLLYLAVSYHGYGVYDFQAMSAVTHNLVDHFTLKTTGAFHDAFGLNTPYSQYGLGESLALIPFYAASKFTGDQGFWESLYNPVIVTASVAVLHLVARTLSWSRLVSVLAALTFGTLTMALQSTTDGFSEPGVGLCVLVIVLAALRWREGWKWSPLALGLAVAAAIQFRSDSLLTIGVAVLALPFFVPRSELLSRRALLWAGTPVLLSAAFLLWYNHLRYGHLFVTDYSGSGSFATPLFEGMRGLLVSPGRGLFVFNPIAIPGLVGLALLWTRDRPLALLTMLLIVPRLIFFSRWGDWFGGICWGPRFLMPVVFLFILGAFSLTSSADIRPIIRRAGRVAVALAALLSIPISYLSVRVSEGVWHGAFTDPVLRSAIPILGRLPSKESTLFAHELWTWDYSILHGNWLLLRAGRAPMAPFWWHHHGPAVGWLLLLVFAAGAVLAIGAATTVDRKERRQEVSGRRAG